MILSVTLNPAVDHVLFLDKIKVGDTNRVARVERDAGGKGVNVSRVVAELGGESLASGFLGGGPGAYVRAVLERQGVAHDFVEVAGETRTNFTVEEDDVDAPPTTFNERGPTIRPDEMDALLATCRELASRARWACIGGSVPPGLPPDVFLTLGRLFADAGCRVCLDADAEPLARGISCRPHFIKPNHKECSRLLGVPVEDHEAAAEAARGLLDQVAEGGFVVVSLGAEGAVLACAEGVYRGHSPPVEPRSTVGSGDSLIGGLLWALGEGHPLPEAFRWGLAAGAATATTDGSEIARQPVVHHLLPEARVETL